MKLTPVTVAVVVATMGALAGAGFMIGQQRVENRQLAKLLEKPAATNRRAAQSSAATELADAELAAEVARLRAQLSELQGALTTTSARTAAPARVVAIEPVFAAGGAQNALGGVGSDLPRFADDRLDGLGAAGMSPLDDGDEFAEGEYDEPLEDELAADESDNWDDGVDDSAQVRDRDREFVVVNDRNPQVLVVDYEPDVYYAGTTIYDYVPTYYVDCGAADYYTGWHIGLSYHYERSYHRSSGFSIGYYGGHGSHRYGFSYGYGYSPWWRDYSLHLSYYDNHHSGHHYGHHSYGHHDGHHRGGRRQAFKRGYRQGYNDGFDDGLGRGTPTSRPVTRTAAIAKVSKDGPTAWRAPGTRVGSGPVASGPTRRSDTPRFDRVSRRDAVTPDGLAGRSRGSDTPSAKSRGGPRRADVADTTASKSGNRGERGTRAPNRSDDTARVRRADRADEGGAAAAPKPATSGKRRGAAPTNPAASGRRTAESATRRSRGTPETSSGARVVRRTEGSSAGDTSARTTPRGKTTSPPRAARTDTQPDPRATNRRATNPRTANRGTVNRGNTSGAESARVRRGAPATSDSRSPGASTEGVRKSRGSRVDRPQATETPRSRGATEPVRRSTTPPRTQRSEPVRRTTPPARNDVRQRETPRAEPRRERTAPRPQRAAPTRTTPTRTTPTRTERPAPTRTRQPQRSQPQRNRSNPNRQRRNRGDND